MSLSFGGVTLNHKPIPGRYLFIYFHLKFLYAFSSNIRFHCCNIVHFCCCEVILILKSILFNIEEDIPASYVELILLKGFFAYVVVMSLSSMLLWSKGVEDGLELYRLIESLWNLTFPFLTTFDALWNFKILVNQWKIYIMINSIFQHCLWKEKNCLNQE